MVRGSWRVGPAHAPSALRGRFPTPNLRSPQNSARRGSPLQLPAGPRPAGEGSRAPARAAKVPPPPGWGDQSERRGTATLPDLLPPSTIREAPPPGPPRRPASPFPPPAHVKRLLPSSRPPPAPPHRPRVLPRGGASLLAALPRNLLEDLRLRAILSLNNLRQQLEPDPGCLVASLRSPLTSKS